MRQIVLDTETTGLEVAQGHRVIELAGVEVLNRRLTRHHFHRYLNPQRKIDEAAKQVHGIADDFLLDKPKFTEIAHEFVDYVRGAELIIHNAAFDVAFLNYELSVAGLGAVTDYCSGVVDTLAMAREAHPGKRASLDALCERYQVDNRRRTLHGALLDAELLAEVYLAMTRGQESFVIDLGLAGTAGRRMQAALGTLELIVLRASEAELAEHQEVLAHIDRECKAGSLWGRLAGAAE